MMQIAKRDLLLTGKKIYLIGREIVSLFLFLCYCNVCFNYLVKKGIIGNYQLSYIKLMYVHSDTKELSVVHHNKETLCFLLPLCCCPYISMKALGISVSILIP